MRENKLAELSMEFAVKAINFCSTIKGHYSLINQLERSATSIGANISEAQRAQSKADFNAKMNISLKEANETYYWLRLLHRTDFISDEAFNSIEKDVNEIISILVSICKQTNK